MVNKQQENNVEGNVLRIGCEYPPCVSDLAAVAESYIQQFINGQLTEDQLRTLCVYVLCIVKIFLTFSSKFCRKVVLSTVKYE